MSSKDRVNVANTLLISAPFSAEHAARCVTLAAEAIQIDGNVDAYVLLGTILKHRPGFPGITRDIHRAIYLFERAVALGSETACAKLGSIYLQGSGVPQNKPRALGLFERVAESHPIFPSIRKDLALLLICQEPGVRQDESRAANLLHNEIRENNCVYTKYVLANLLARPRGNIAYDGVRAIPLLENILQTIEYDDAVFLLGLLLSTHTTGERDTNRAISLLQTAMERNVPHSKVFLARTLLCTGDPTRVHQGTVMCEELIQQKSCIMAHVFLADYLSGYKDGRVSPGLDDNRACQLYYRAIVIAFGNNARKLQDVGLHPDNSYEPSESEADKQGIAYATINHYHQQSMISLATYCVSGVFPVELEKAEKLFMFTTADLGAVRFIAQHAENFLFRLEETMNRAAKDSSLRARAMAFCLRVCQRMEIFIRVPGIYGFAKRLQADILLKGQGEVDLDTKRRAIQLYKRAAERGNPEALLSLGNIAYYGQYSERKSNMDAFAYFAQVIQLRLPQSKRRVRHAAIVKMATIFTGCEQRRRRRNEEDSPDDMFGTEESLVL